ncbi:MAG TPA: hypothetical protein VN700_14925 [Vicinamibacterales bacterium]|nr:hypothetical protein [Vicinamibacterales bacterium]
MNSQQGLRVVFRVAAGPGIGYGHLVRCGVLSRVLDSTMQVALRAEAGAESVAGRLGWTLLPDDRSAIRDSRADLVVIDDPAREHAAPWVELARRSGVPVASIHDLGIGRLASDLSIDGSLALMPGGVQADLQGPEFAVLDPLVGALRHHSPRRIRGRVLVALGGGAHVHEFGPAIAAQVRRLLPRVRVVLAGGLHINQGRRAPLPAGCQWVDAPNGLAVELARASVAVLAGGVTLYEACALGTPVVAVSLTPEQGVTTRAFAQHGAVLNAGHIQAVDTADRAAARITDLLTGTLDAEWLARRGRQLVDGHGAVRVADRLRTLCAAMEHRRVA